MENPVTAPTPKDPRKGVAHGYQRRFLAGSGAGWDQATWPTSPGTADTTTWIYQESTGLLTVKTYADSNVTAYTYDSAGRLATRTWARQVNSQDLITTYSYDASTGELTEIDYSDATPDVTFTYTRTGQKATVTESATGTHTFTYTNDSDEYAFNEYSETIDGDLYDKVITREYGRLGRPTRFEIGTSGDHDANYDVTYSYGSDGRFGGVETAVPSSFSATYGYLENSNLIETVQFPNDIRTTRHYEEHRDLLDWIKNGLVGQQTPISQYDYTNDAAGRRTAAGWSGSAFSQGDTIAYGYNSRSEVTAATAANRTAYDFDYSYDNIGNRDEYAVAGGTPTGYTPNELNQYEVTVDPTEAFYYDDDGNLSEDGDFEYTWDAENRLIAVEATGIVKVEFTYDYMSRRVRKVSSDWQGGNWVQQTDQKFVYDGWNPVLELASGGDLPATTARTWGLDLSQTLQGAGLPAIASQATAGGVGGLLATHLSSQVNAFVYDGNGNISEALRVSNGSIEAHYEYDPFGNTTASSGTWAGANPYRFSTKWFDGETRLYYYGLRYYSPRLGRWASRGEQVNRVRPCSLAIVRQAKL